MHVAVLLAVALLDKTLLVVRLVEFLHRRCIWKRVLALDVFVHKFGESVLVEDAVDYLQGASTVADLFSGLGTFAFALAGPRKVLAVEAARDAHLACKAAANGRQAPVLTLHRDLFRNPLQAEEASRFDAILLDPPRAGAREQIAQIAGSTATRVAYVSCNPASWARDAKVLVDAGFRLRKLRPVGQFRWSIYWVS